MRNSHCRTCGEKTQKKWIMRHKHCLIWNMARTLKNMENEIYTLQDIDYGEKTKQTKKKTFKMRLKHCRWNMAKKLKNVDIEKHTLQVLYYGEKTKKRGK